MDNAGCVYGITPESNRNINGQWNTFVNLTVPLANLVNIEVDVSFSVDVGKVLEVQHYCQYRLCPYVFTGPDQ